MGVTDTTRKLKLAHWNANGVRNKTQELAQFLHNNDIDVLLLNETHLKPSLDLIVQNYKTYRSDRLGRPGGGVAALVRNRIRSALTESPLTPTIEHVDVEIHTSNQEKIRLSAIYTPPQNSWTQKT